MLIRAIILNLLAIFVVASVSSAAFADGWKVVTVDGDAATFQAGAWTKITRGAVVFDDAIMRVPGNGSMRLMRGKESISLGADTQIQIFDKPSERYTTVNLHAGTVGVEAEIENVKHFEVQSPLMSVVVKGTIFGVHTEPQVATVVVQRGVVYVADAWHRTSGEVHLGQAAKVTANHGVVIGPALAADADANAASFAATMASAPLVLTPDEQPKADADAKSLLNATSVKAVADAGASADADEVSSELRRAGVGRKASRKDLETTAKVAANFKDSLDGGYEPDEEEAFYWIEGKDGKAILTPIFEMIGRLQGFECYAFWAILSLSFSFIGILITLILTDTGFGFFVNTFIAVMASVGAVLIRDCFFYNARNIKFEPGLTAGLVISSIGISIVGLAYIRARAIGN